MTDLFDPFAFAVGMVALVNPCGFALLPAYLGFFLGQKDDEPSRIISLNRAQGVGLSMTLGFLTVFGLVGILFSGLRSAIQEWLPYFNITLGIGLTILGLAMLRGFQLVLKIPKLEKGTGSDSFVSMFLFGVSYALASLSCTIGLFLTAVGTSSTSGSGFFDSLGSFVSYGLGMGLLASFLTLLVALGRRGLVNKFRSILPVINIISGVLLLLVGPYMIGYGIWEIQVLNGGDVTPVWLDNFMVGAADVQASISNWFSAKVNVFGREMSRTALLGWPFFALNLGLIVAGFAARRRRDDDGSSIDGDAEMASAAS